MAETTHYIDADGGWFNLHDRTNYWVTYGEKGKRAQEFEFVVENIYGVDGDVLRNTKTKSYDLEIPIVVYGSTASNLEANIRALRYATHPKRGQGFLRYVTNDSKTRYLRCHLSDFVNVDSQEDGAGSTYYRRFVFTFTTHDPYWFDPTLNEILWTDATTTLLYQQTVTNNGELDTQPVWDIKGPLDEITITNTTTGKYLYLDYTLTAAQHIYVDTREGEWTIYLDHVTNVGYAKVVGSDYFPLVHGQNLLNFTFAGSPTSATSVKCSWYDRYGGI